MKAHLLIRLASVVVIEQLGFVIFKAGIEKYEAAVAASCNLNGKGLAAPDPLRQKGRDQAGCVPGYLAFADDTTLDGYHVSIFSGPEPAAPESSKLMRSFSITRGRCST